MIIKNVQFLHFNREVYDMAIVNLPKYQPGRDKPLCDVCKKKGKDVQPAVMYCTTCSKKHCQKHKEVGIVI